MKQATFKRCTDPGDLDTIIGWLGANYDYNSRCPSENCITAFSTVDFTQQEMDDITADAAAKFMEVTFE